MNFPDKFSLKKKRKSGENINMGKIKCLKQFLLSEIFNTVTEISRKYVAVSFNLNDTVILEGKQEGKLSLLIRETLTEETLREVKGKCKIIIN